MFRSDTARKKSAAREAPSSSGGCLPMQSAHDDCGVCDDNDDNDDNDDDDDDDDDDDGA